MVFTTFQTKLLLVLVEPDDSDSDYPRCQLSEGQAQLSTWFFRSESEA